MNSDTRNSIGSESTQGRVNASKEKVGDTRRLVEIALGSSGSAPTRAKKHTVANASEMAGAAIDRLADQTASPEVRAKRKRRLLRGPSEFREMREDHPKPEE